MEEYYTADKQQSHEELKDDMELSQPAKRRIRITNDNGIFIYYLLLFIIIYYYLLLLLLLGCIQSVGNFWTNSS